ncbi:hypothetical protein [Nesterenkonia sp. NBAIMH1]|uniref:hypothetical protein n=1 Tax=Nesterenkonia sp. NBAIMH1 TaxID=2600320 RepID=UPI0011B40531|nr:hypothetical protein [Nesterenkonia sp. NBAIMH1]
MASAANADANSKQYLDDDISAIFTSFLQVDVFIPSVSAADDDGFSPLLMKGLDGGPILPVYTSDEAVPAELREQVETVAEVPGQGWSSRWPTSWSFSTTGQATSSSSRPTSGPGSAPRSSTLRRHE